jgi:hypothetical protein
MHCCASLCWRNGRGPHRFRPFGAYGSVLLAEIPWLCTRGDCRVAVVHSCALFWIGARGLCVFRLSFSRGQMPLACRSLLFRCRTRLNPAASTVEADAALRTYLDTFVIYIVETSAIEVVD